jgi:hypothetical protein
VLGFVEPPDVVEGVLGELSACDEGAVVPVLGADADARANDLVDDEGVRASRDGLVPRGAGEPSVGASASAAPVSSGKAANESGSNGDSGPRTSVNASGLPAIVVSVGTAPLPSAGAAAMPAPVTRIANVPAM